MIISKDRLLEIRLRTLSTHSSQKKMVMSYLFKHIAMHHDRCYMTECMMKARDTGLGKRVQATHTISANALS